VGFGLFQICSQLPFSPHSKDRVLQRWTTHFIAFDCLCDLKNSMRRAVISRREDIISVQVGAERNRQKKQKLEDDAAAHCELVDDGGFW
jgi:muramidase (phage lysozyme)